MFHILGSVCAFLETTEYTEILTRDGRDELWLRCQDGHDEFHELFTQVYDRLHRVHRELGGCGRGNLRRSVGVLVLVRRLVARFQAAVTRRREQHVLVRFATKRATLGRVKALHKVLDALFGHVELESDPLMAQWETLWPTQCDRMYEVFQARVKDPKPLVARVPNAEIAEFLGLMKYEFVYFSKEQAPNQAELLDKTMKKVIRCSSVHVPTISSSYVPSVEIDLGEDHSKVKDTRCQVKHGVYDQETQLVAQYLSADSRYARQLFWHATEMWHGFHHQNVAKMMGESMLELQPLVLWEDVAAHGNFIHFFATEHEDNQKQLWRKFLQVGHGLYYIHQQGGTHGNLKCSHILLAEDGTPKICHFELSQGRDTCTFDRWKGPEYNLGKGLDPSKPGDVYAFGLCIIEARTGNIPYDVDCDDAVMSQLETLECYPRPYEMRHDEWKVVKRFVAHNPEERPTMAQAIEMVEKLAWKEAMEEEAGKPSVKTAK